MCDDGGTGRSRSGVHRVPGGHRDDAAGAVLVGAVLRHVVHTGRRQPVRPAGDGRDGARRRVPGAATGTSQGGRRRRRLRRPVPTRTAAVLPGLSRSDDPLMLLLNWLVKHKFHPLDRTCRKLGRGPGLRLFCQRHVVKKRLQTSPGTCRKPAFLSIF